MQLVYLKSTASLFVCSDFVFDIFLRFLVLRPKIDEFGSSSSIAKALGKHALMLKAELTFDVVKSNLK